MSEFTSPRSLLALAARPWDLLVIGGGIMGAGIMREAARCGLRVLLVEQGDFASGTSSRSSKLIHGGLHYLTRFQIGLVRAAVRERERLLHDGAGLVEALEFLIPAATGDRHPPWLVMVGLGVYDAFAGRLHVPQQLIPAAIERCAPGLDVRFTAAFAYQDAQIDDARLVLRVLQEGCRLGGHALSYVAVTDLLRDADGGVIGARLRDVDCGCTVEVRARAVVNATGPWADRLRGRRDAPARLRLVRGSHLVFPRMRLRLTHAVAARHPDSDSPVFLVPWEGVTLVGTTHVEDGRGLDEDPRISPEEAAYLLRGVQALFPSLRLGRADIAATFAGIRPIVDARTRDPAKASRDSAIWAENGLLTVTGGKLTTFRAMARKALQMLSPRLPELRRPAADAPALAALPPLPRDLPFDHATACRLLARYGPEGLEAIAALPPPERRPLPGQRTLWGELRWAARAEGVRHLDDLLLRRVRLGLTAPAGGIPWLDQIRPLVQSELGWDDARWEAEAAAYRETWQRAHSVPEF